MLAVLSHNWNRDRPKGFKPVQFRSVLQAKAQGQLGTRTRTDQPGLCQAACSRRDSSKSCQAASKEVLFLHMRPASVKRLLQSRVVSCSNIRNRPVRRRTKDQARDPKESRNKSASVVHGSRRDRVGIPDKRSSRSDKVSARVLRKDSRHTADDEAGHMGQDPTITPGQSGADRGAGGCGPCRTVQVPFTELLHDRC